MLKIYKSSAGSGKTYTLVREYLRLAFAKTTKYKNILAITFTNKAAAEMKNRILEALEGISKGEKEYDSLKADLCEATGKSEEQLQREAHEILRSMLHNYADISVSTIDSFVHKVVRAFAHDLQIPMNFDIEMDSKKLLHDAVALLLDRLSVSDSQITQAVLEFAEGKIEEGKSWNVDFEIQKLGNELFVDEALPYVQQLSFIEFEKMREARAALYAQMRMFEKKLYDEGKKAFSLIISNNLTAADFHRTNQGIFGWFQKYNDEKFPPNPTGNSWVHETVFENKWGKKFPGESIKDDLIESFNHILSIWDKEGRDYYLCDLLLKNFYAFILLADLQKLLEEIKKEGNLLHIGDFHHKVFEIVKQQEAPVIYERIGEKYDNILIDEFQDTSVIQWRNLLPLIENSQFKNEDSLIVGDAKQSIYRFRGGVAEQFVVLPKVYGSDEDELLKQREIAVNNYGAEVELLESNYRSTKEIIAFNNAFYKQMLELPELKNKAIYSDYFQKSGKDKSGGFVSIEFLKGNDEGLNGPRCERVDEIIREALIRGYSYRDIAVLARSNNTASEIASYLVQREIRVVSPESLLINQSQKVQLLLAAFNYLNRKDNKIARAEMFYYSRLLHGQTAHFERLDFEGSSLEFEELFRDETQLQFDSHALSTGRLADLTQQLIRLFKLNDDDPFLQFFLDEILLYSSRYGNSVGDFLVWWSGVKHKKSIVYPESLDAVRIMTIHKAKGLQFPVVILADAVEEKRLTKSFFWVPLEKKYLPQLHIGLLPRNKQMLQTEFASLYETEDEQSFLDVLNLLYVGTTRPEDALYILSEELEKEPKENNSVTALLISFLRSIEQWDGFQQYVFGEQDYKKKGKDEKKAKFEMYGKGETVSANLLASAIKVKMKAQALWSEETVGKIDEGNLLHEALKRVKYEGDEDIVLNKMKAAGLLNDTEHLVLLSKVKAVVYHAELNALFKKDLAVITERPILRHDQSMRIPDRVVIKNGDAIILDYKTGKRETSHAGQVNRYAQWLQEAGLRVDEKIIFYTGEELKEVIA